MKRRKILVFIPLLGLFLSGCTFQEGLETAKSFVGDKVYHPVKDWVESLIGKKEEEKKDEGGDQPTPTPTPTPTPSEVTPVEITEVKAPESIEQGKTLAPSSVSLSVKYSDNSTKSEKATKVELDTKVVKEDVEGTAYFNELSKKFTIDVTEPPVVETYTPEVVIQKCDEAGEGVVVEGLLRVRGQVALGATKTSNGWGGTFVTEGEKVLKFDSARSETEYETIEGKIVTIEGYAELYNGDYKVGYLPATASPTGAKFNPSLISVEDAPQKTVKSILGVEGPKKVYQNSEVTVEDFVVSVEYSDGTEGQVRPDAIVSGDTSEVGDITFVVKVGELEGSCVITVVEKPAAPVHAGTLEDPYTVSDAKLIYDGLEDGEISPECYVTGTIADSKTPSISGGRGRFDLTDGLCETNLYVYNINNIGGKADLTVDDISVGNVVVAKGGIKNYGGTFELCYNKENPAIACELISIEKPTVLVTGIKLSAEEENMLVGYADLTLTATVSPENASNKELDWVSNNEEVATVANGVVHAVAEGDAVITAKATDGSGIEATCTVHVSVPEVEVVEVVVSVMPQVEYTEGDLLDLSEMELTVTKSDESVEEHVTTGYTTNIALDHELTKDDTSLVVTYGGVDAEPIALTINEKTKPSHAGTLEDPYTVSDAKLIYDDLEAGDISPECYVTGTIADTKTPSVSSGRGRFDLTDGVCETNLYVFNINNVGGKNDLTVGDIPVGSVVVAKGGIKKYVEKDESLTFEFCYNKENPAIACELISIDKPVINPTEVTIEGAASVQEGKTTTLTATVEPVGAPQDVVWTSDNDKVATVNENGVVTGVSEGTALITATAVDHETVFGTHEITVTPKPSEPTETDVYTLTPASGSNNGYAGNCDITIDGITWNLTGNSTMQPWRLGGKSLDGVDRELYSKTAISDNITKIEVEHGAASGITVNSATLIVSQNDDFSEPVSTVSFDFVASAKTTIERPEGADWSSCYYKFVYNLTVSGTSNKFIEFTGAVFYAVV